MSQPPAASREAVARIPSPGAQPTVSRAPILDTGVLWILLSAAGFGSMAIFGKLAYSGGLNLPTLLAGRFTVAALLMWGLLAARRVSPRLPPRTLAGLVGMGGLGYVGQSFSFFTALQTVSAASTSLLLYTYPAIVAVLAWLLLKQPLSRAGLLALLLALTGCLLVLGGPEALPAGKNPAGLVWALAAAAIYALYIITGTRLTANVPPLLATTYIITAAAAVYDVGGLLGGTLDLHVAPWGWASLAAIAVICTVLAIGAFVAGLARVGPARASILSTVEPPVTLLLAVVVLGESVGFLQIAGGALILSAVLVLQWPGTKAPSPALAAPPPAG